VSVTGSETTRDPAVRRSALPSPESYSSASPIERWPPRASGATVTGISKVASSPGLRSPTGTRVSARPTPEGGEGHDDDSVPGHLVPGDGGGSRHGAFRAGPYRGLGEREVGTERAGGFQTEPHRSSGPFPALAVQVVGSQPECVVAGLGPVRHCHPVGQDPPIAGFDGAGEAGRAFAALDGHRRVRRRERQAGFPGSQRPDVLHGDRGGVGGPDAGVRRDVDDFEPGALLDRHGDAERPETLLWVRVPEASEM